MSSLHACRWSEFWSPHGHHAVGNSHSVATTNDNRGRIITLAKSTRNLTPDKSCYVAKSGSVRVAKVGVVSSNLIARSSFH
ncbi:hypothetical protein U91I_01024 [alpha proteobacterium U9-1i]|nr:hypothetical protein U91I_01024 [alpha proteobacterium U9-1i]